ncbi:Sel1-like repeat family protein, partial [Skeletonema marinoi]
MRVKQLLMRRVEANDPAATYQAGVICSKEGDYKGAAAYFTKAAGSGDISAHFDLSGMYREGEGVEKDEKKHLHHLEQAAIGGHPNARHNLAIFEWKSGRTERTVKHFIIAANMGNDESLESLKKCYGMGLVSKEKFAAALRGHQAAVDAMKSPIETKQKRLYGYRDIGIVFRYRQEFSFVCLFSASGIPLHSPQLLRSKIIITNQMHCE